jgi:hypothetical protein
MLIMKFTKKQLEKIADQTRLLSWAIGAIITSSSGFHLPLNLLNLSAIVVAWLMCQTVALVLDKWSEK